MKNEIYKLFPIGVPKNSQFTGIPKINIAPNAVRRQNKPKKRQLKFPLTVYCEFLGTPNEA